MWVQEGKCEGNPPTVEAFVSGVKALGLGADSGWSSWFSISEVTEDKRNY